LEVKTRWTQYENGKSQWLIINLTARDEFLRLFFDGTFEKDADNIDRYFMYFAFAARKEADERRK